MKYHNHVYVNKFLSHFFWYFLLPVLVFIITIPFTYPLVYYAEANMGQNSEYVQENLFHRDKSNYKFSYEFPESKAIKMNAGITDYRVIVLERYFAMYNSPLQGLGNFFVAKCDEYGAPYDCTMLPAIAKVETALCNYPPSQRQKNCWGFGGSGTNRIYFKSYEDAIDLITYRLVNSYGYEYMEDAVRMQYTYCGRHCDKWGGIVEKQRDFINQLSVDMGFPRLF